MVENAGFTDIGELPITIIGGLLLIAFLLLILGAELLSAEQNGHDTDFVHKLKEKEHKLKEKEEHLKEIEKQLRGH